MSGGGNGCRGDNWQWKKYNKNVLLKNLTLPDSRLYVLNYYILLPLAEQQKKNFTYYVVQLFYKL